MAKRASLLRKVEESVRAAKKEGTLKSADELAIANGEKSESTTKG
nr:MAG TPA: hypothetical protein [Caudoviricetes sp.]